MEVKTIFKTLIGTVVVIVVMSVISEYFNVSTTGLQIGQITKIACKQACELFSQETYKEYDSESGNGGSIAMNDVYDCNGNEYISGDFYGSTDPSQIYKNLYTSDDFKAWLKTDAVVDGDWTNLKLIDLALNHADSLDLNSESTEYNDSMLAIAYKDVMMTPDNMGIPYLDKTTVNRMFQWNLAEILSNCSPSLIKVDENNEQYILYKGFRVYASEAKITNLEYKTYDLSTEDGRKEFQDVTNIDPNNLGFEDLNNKLKSTADERTRVCIVGVQYSIPMVYEGITFLKQLISYAWNQEVSGVSGGSNSTGGNQKWNGAKVDFNSGGIYGNDTSEGVLPLPGKLIYYIIR